TTPPAMEFSEILKNERLSHIIIETLQEDYDAVDDRIETEENKSVILTLAEAEGMYSMNFVKASSGPVNDSSMHLLSSAVADQFEIFRIDTLGITGEQTSMLHAAIETKVTMTDISGNPIIKEDTSISFVEYWFLYGILFIVLMVNVMASTQIATSIVSDKSTRVIEYLLISVKPLALMVGKILAMLSAVLLQMISMVVILFLSNTASTLLSSGSSESIMAQYIPKNIFENLNIFNIVLCFLLIMLGLLFYATLAGLAGATVSRLEEVGEGLMLFTFANLIGAYVGMGAASVLMGAGVNGYVTFTFLFPLSSPFILPGAILAGKASLPIVAAAIVLQIVFIVLLFNFVAKVFETLILHNGNKIKVSELIKLSKIVSKGERK
ncbi:MAG: ABC transporter permease, partial [Mobilitalea sp.]